MDCRCHNHMEVWFKTTCISVYHHKSWFSFDCKTVTSVHNRPIRTVYSFDMTLWLDVFRTWVLILLSGVKHHKLTNQTKQKILWHLARHDHYFTYADVVCCSNDIFVMKGQPVVVLVMWLIIPYLHSEFA